MEFMLRYKTASDHWFSLRREGERQAWKWTNGSIFSNWFNISAKGFCAYLGDQGAFSARCDTLRNWICSKSLLDLPTNTSSLESGYQLMKMNCSVPES
ncbi:C-type lectin domain family 2 member D-like [Heteronotia binoei]|uniref:C-type lectin domain family 2 member D-like n=1 Tax=Heteronotia binoei TaxID=13085 RepID=UPI00292DB19D|nr:C-type lectin domain family 2 member D-like [Heteronotia binoei]